MSAIVRLHQIYQSAGLTPMTGHCPGHMFQWRDAPFTRFLRDDGSLVGCFGLSVHELLVLEPLNRHIDPRRILVVGNAHGWSSIALALFFPGAMVVGLDPEAEGIALTNRLAADHGLAVRGVVGSSPGDVPDAVRRYLGGPVDLVLVDAVHSNEAVVGDVRGVHPLAAPDALYILHDVINWNLVDGVREAQRMYGLRGRVLTRTASGMAVLHRDIPTGLDAYLSCFADDPDRLRLYREQVRAEHGDRLADTLARL